MVFVSWSVLPSGKAFVNDRTALQEQRSSHLVILSQPACRRDRVCRPFGRPQPCLIGRLTRQRRQLGPAAGSCGVRTVLVADAAAAVEAAPKVRHATLVADMAVRYGISRQVILITLLVVAVLAAGGGFILFMMLRGPFAGKLSHDFGVVMIEGERSSFEHTFVLTNRTDQTFEITQARPSCGCTAAKVSDEIIEPGEQFAVHTTLTLSKSGRRTSDVTLYSEQGPLQKLHLEATGRRSNPLSASREQIVLEPGRSQVVVVMAEVYEDDQPPSEPQVKATADVDVQVGEWSLARERRRARREPARYRAFVEISTSAELSAPASLEVTVDVEDEQHSLTIQLVPRQTTEQPAPASTPAPAVESPGT